MLVEDFDVVARVFLGRECVELAADGINLLGDIFSRAAAGAFEQHVLDEMRDSAALSRFVTRSAGEPDADADRPNLRHRFGENPEPVVENVSDDECVGQNEAWKVLCYHRKSGKR
jgi:hypothetical protein